MNQSVTSAVATVQLVIKMANGSVQLFNAQGLKRDLGNKILNILLCRLKFYNITCWPLFMMFQKLYYLTIQTKY